MSLKFSGIFISLDTDLHAYSRFSCEESGAQRDTSRWRPQPWPLSSVFSPLSHSRFLVFELSEDSEPP